MVLIVSNDACMQGAQGSNPTDGWSLVGIEHPLLTFSHNFGYYVYLYYMYITDLCTEIKFHVMNF